MSSIVNFDGKGDVASWETKIKSKLIAKRYKNQIIDRNRPVAQGANAPGPDLRVQWNANADKTVGIIFMHVKPDIVNQFQYLTTLQTVLEDIRNYFPGASPRAP